MALLVAGLLSGCATAPTDLGRSEVDALVEARGVALPKSAHGAVADLLQSPLTAESAVKLALINNPDLQGHYAELGFEAADLVDGSSVSNPLFSASVLDPDAAGERDLVTLGLAVSLVDLITLPARRRYSESAFAAFRQALGARVLAAAVSAQEAFYRYQASQQVVELRRQAATAADLSARLAQRFADAGNLEPGVLATHLAEAAEARLNALMAESNAAEARAELATMLGLSTGDQWTVLPSFFLPPADSVDVNDLLQRARSVRLDLAAARARAGALADRLGVVNKSRWLDGLELGIERERETDGERLTGPTLEWHLPLFRQGRSDVLRAEAQLAVAASEVQRAAMEVENSVLLAHAQFENARARVAEYRVGLLPQRAEALVRAQERFNYMLTGVFELIDIKRAQYDDWQGYLEAIRDYWIARARLNHATGGALPLLDPASGEPVSADLLLEPAGPSGHEHMHHENPDQKQHQHHEHGGAQ